MNMSRYTNLLEIWRAVAIDSLFGTGEKREGTFIRAMKSRYTSLSLFFKKYLFLYVYGIYRHLYYLKKLL